MIPRFSEEYAQYSGTHYAVFMPHGTDSISAALAGALDLDGFSDGGEVIVPNYTFVATASAVLERNCKVVFVDVCPDSFTIDPQAIAAARLSARCLQSHQDRRGGRPPHLRSDPRSPAPRAHVCLPRALARPH